MAPSWIIFIVVTAGVAILGALLLGPWAAGIALLMALAVWLVVATLVATGTRRAEEEGAGDGGAAAKPAREPTPPAEPSH
jgi:hypothetical protein